MLWFADEWLDLLVAFIALTQGLLVGVCWLDFLLVFTLTCCLFILLLFTCCRRFRPVGTIFGLAFVVDLLWVCCFVGHVLFSVVLLGNPLVCFAIVLFKILLVLFVGIGMLTTFMIDSGTGTVLWVICYCDELGLLGVWTGFALMFVPSVVLFWFPFCCFRLF